MALDQASRMLGLSTPLGDNALLLTGFRGQEEMSRLFHFDLDMLSDDNAIAAADIVGKNVTFSVKLADDTPRFFNGFVNRFYAGEEDETGRRTYRAEVVPWLWFLTRTTDCRIFQNKTVPQIIEQVFGDLGFSDFKLQATGNHPQREFVVQYRESDFQFVSRLLEEEGMFYFFQHEDGKHNLIMADHAGAYVDCGENEVTYPRDLGSLAMEANVTSWEHRYEFRSGKIAHTDYNFKTPSTSLMADSSTMVSLPGNDKYEFYDYPGIYGNSGDGRGLADVRMEEEEVEHDVVEGTGLCKTFSPGGKFKITHHRSASEEGKTFVLTSVIHEASEVHAYETGGEAEGGYRNTFTCIPDSVTFRPERITRKPFVQGVQTAVVVGPSGEEIFTDEFGRVKVQFHWDREGKKDENSSCWIRVSQNWAGQNWGIVFNPRIGQEVIVDFIEGDPDRPIITGRVYNAEQMPPYPLPAEQTKSTIKTRSSKGGGPDNFNEIRFEDKKGEEQLFVHAEKNQDIEVENDETHWVGHDRTKTVDNDETTLVKGNRTEDVGKNETISVDGDRTEKVRKNESISIDGNRTEKVGKDETINIAGKRTESVSKDESISISGNREKTVNKGESITIGENLSFSVAKNKTIDVGRKLQIKVADEISLTTGQASIVLKKDGTIQISGKDIIVKGSGKITGKASKDIILKGKKILHN